MIEKRYFAKNSAKDLAKKLIKILQDDDLRSRLGARSLELAARYSEKHQAEQLAKLYHNAVAARAQAAAPPKRRGLKLGRKQPR